MAPIIKKENQEIIPEIVRTATTPIKLPNNNNNNHQPIMVVSDSSSSSSSDADDEVLDSLMQNQKPNYKKNKFDYQNVVNNGESSSKKVKFNDHGNNNNPRLTVPSGVLAAIPLRMIPPPQPQPPPSSKQGRRTAVGGGAGSKQQAVSTVVRGSCKQFWKAGDYEEPNASDYSSSPDYAVGMDRVRVHPRFLHSNATSHRWALGAFAELLDNALDEVAHGCTYVNVDVMKNKKDNSPMILVEDNGGGMAPHKMRQCMSLGYSAKSKMANTIGQYGNGFKTSTMRLGADVIVFSSCKGKDGKSNTQSIGLLSYTFLRTTRKEDIVVPMVDFDKNGTNWDKTIRSSKNDWDMNFKTILQWSPFVTEDELLQQAKFDVLGEQGTRIIIYNLWDDDEGNLELDFVTDKHDIQIRTANRNNIQMARQFPNSKHFLTYQHSLRTYASILYLTLPSGFRITLRGKDVEHHNIIDDMMLIKGIHYKPLQIRDGEFNTNMAATGKLGFVKDAHHHIDVQGFNVYHKNRLIKPFWRVWNPAGSDGRGVIGVVEANFVEPAHDKQGFERTTVLSRLEAKLVGLQKEYWGERCHLIGYAARRQPKNSPDSEHSNANNSSASNKKGKQSTGGIRLSPPAGVAGGNQQGSPSVKESITAKCEKDAVTRGAQASTSCNASVEARLRNMGGIEDNRLKQSLQYEQDRCRRLETQLQEMTKELEIEKKKAQDLDRENIILVEMLESERNKHEATEEELRKKITTASETIGNLLGRVRELEAWGVPKMKVKKN